MSIDQTQLDRLRELAEAAKAGGWNEVVAGLDMGDIVLGIREHGSKGDQKAAAEAAGMSVATLWRRAKLAEHRDLIERERPANLTEAWRLVQKLEAEEKAEGDGGEEKPARGRRKRDPLEVLKERLCSTVATIAQQGLMREADVILAVRGAYRAGVKVKAEYEAATRDHEEMERDAVPAEVIPLAGRKRSKAKLEVVEGGKGPEADGSTGETDTPKVETATAAPETDGSAEETIAPRVEETREPDAGRPATDPDLERQVRALAYRQMLHRYGSVESFPAREEAEEMIKKIGKRMQRYSSEERRAQAKGDEYAAHRARWNFGRQQAEMRRWQAVLDVAADGAAEGAA